jgi:hypothetical protein
MACVSSARPFSESSRLRAAISTPTSWSGASLTTSSKNKRTSGEGRGPPAPPRGS